MDNGQVVLSLENVSIHYGQKPAVSNVCLQFPRRSITAIIGPSGTGKSTLLRALNRMLDTNAKVSGRIDFEGVNIYGPGVEEIDLRRQIGMVFQKPLPLPMSIFENVAFGPRLHGIKKRCQLEEIVEDCLTRAALWNDVKDRLYQTGDKLSGGQQQRLCIARTIANEPEVILMDEPCASLDPGATSQIEDLIHSLAQELTVVLVTHNLEQATRTAEKGYTAFIGYNQDKGCGYLVEHGTTNDVFRNPKQQSTEDYVRGRYG